MDTDQLRGFSMEEQENIACQRDTNGVFWVACQRRAFDDVALNGLLICLSVIDPIPRWVQRDQSASARQYGRRIIWTHVLVDCVPDAYREHF